MWVPRSRGCRPCSSRARYTRSRDDRGNPDGSLAGLLTCLFSPPYLARSSCAAHCWSGGSHGQIGRDSRVSTGRPVRVPLPAEFSGQFVDGHTELRILLTQMQGSTHSFRRRDAVLDPRLSQRAVRDFAEDNGDLDLSFRADGVPGEPFAAEVGGAAVDAVGRGAALLPELDGRPDAVGRGSAVVDPRCPQCPVVPVIKEDGESIGV